MDDVQKSQGDQRLPASEQASAQMKRYGITRIPTEYFEYGGYRYTNLTDVLVM